MTPSIPCSVSSPVPTRRIVMACADPAMHGGQAVDVVETHMAFVFLTAERAFKMKKPIAFNDMDFRSLHARHRVCREEVRLNRRLAPQVYRGLTAVVHDESGTLQLVHDPEATRATTLNGAVVEWLVRMVRLPEDRMLDRALEERAVHRSDVLCTARHLADFFADAPPAEHNAASYRRRLRETIDRNEAALTPPFRGVHRTQVRRVCDAQREFVDARADLLDGRVADGRIIEGHGDLRPEHVCLTDPPAVIDCIEFSRPLRMGDPVDELAFLALECERLGAPSVGRLFQDVYVRRTGDAPEGDLVAFYAGLRALDRARLAVRHLATKDRRRPESVWMDRARTYLRMAGARE